MRRIIPARAGFTLGRAAGCGAAGDHPRSRGVYTASLADQLAVAGSSPLARGLRQWLDSGGIPMGIIPARAGFTGRHQGHARAAGDHPRSRGVYHVAVGGAHVLQGSSPLARGLPGEAPVGGVHDRIIPARAGFTDLPPLAAHGGRDHPRSRGVYGARGSALPRGRGSSPLARGLPPRVAHPADAHGIIPARAGFTLANPWNPNEPVVYQTPAAFTADPGPAPPSCGSAVVVPRWTTTPSGA